MHLVFLQCLAGEIWFIQSFFKPAFALSFLEIVVLLMSYHFPLSIFNPVSYGFELWWGKGRKGRLHIFHAKYLYCYLHSPYSFGHLWILLAVIAKGSGNMYISIKLYFLLIASAVTVSISWWLVSQYHCFSSFLHLVSWSLLIFSFLVNTMD